MSYILYKSVILCYTYTMWFYTIFVPVFALNLLLFSNNSFHVIHIYAISIWSIVFFNLNHLMRREVLYFHGNNLKNDAQARNYFTFGITFWIFHTFLYIMFVYISCASKFSTNAQASAIYLCFKFYQHDGTKACYKTIITFQNICCS